MKQNSCPCTGETLDRFLRPTVMAVLARVPGGLHGYLISRQLREIAIFSDSPPDATGLYRVLKAMEREGYLRSQWDVAGSGPARHVYALTETGRDCLHRWADTLEFYSKTLQQTAKFIRQSTTPKQEKDDRKCSCEDRASR
jgi:DNA-binding PadR family transcriptional regulator